MEVQYASWPAVSLVEVLTVPLPPPPLPQAEPVFDINPLAAKVAHPAVPPAFETISRVVLAVEETDRLVEVALVVVPFITVSALMVEEAVTIIPLLEPLNRAGKIKASVVLVIVHGAAVAANTIAPGRRRDTTM